MVFLSTAVTFCWTYEPPFNGSWFSFHVASIYTIIPKDQLSSNIAWRALLFFERLVPNMTSEESCQHFIWLLLHSESICRANSLDCNLAYRIPQRKCRLNLNDTKQWIMRLRNWALIPSCCWLSSACAGWVLWRVPFVIGRFISTTVSRICHASVVVNPFPISQYLSVWPSEKKNRYSQNGKTTMVCIHLCMHVQLSICERVRHWYPISVYTMASGHPLITACSIRHMDTRHCGHLDLVG